MGTVRDKLEEEAISELAHGTSTHCPLSFWVLLILENLQISGPYLFLFIISQELTDRRYLQICDVCQGPKRDKVMLLWSCAKMK